MDACPLFERSRHPRQRDGALPIPARPRVRRVVAAATANARNYHLSNPLVRGIAHAGLRGLDRVARDRMAARYAWIYDHDVTDGPLAAR